MKGVRRARRASQGVQTLANQLVDPIEHSLSPTLHRAGYDALGLSFEYDAVFVPGGHGPMEDLAVSDDLGRILVTMLDGGKVVSSVCHGPAALTGLVEQVHRAPVAQLRHAQLSDGLERGAVVQRRGEELRREAATRLGVGCAERSKAVRPCLKRGRSGHAFCYIPVRFSGPVRARSASISHPIPTPHSTSLGVP